MGPRGNEKAQFDVCFQDKESFIKFEYQGQVDLDYSIWTKKRIFIIEAKSLNYSGGLDIGWHKLAFPTQRFAVLSKCMGFDISPVYLLRRKTRKTDTGCLFIFSPIKYVYILQI